MHGRNSRSLWKVIFGMENNDGRNKKKQRRHRREEDLIEASGQQFYLNKNIFSALSSSEWDFHEF